MALSLLWVHSEGGPLLLLADILRSSWSGVEPPAPNRLIEATFPFQVVGSATDYDRARDAGKGRLGILSVGNGQALVLGDVPLQTAWLPEDKGPGGWLVRWEHGTSDKAVERALIRTAITQWILGPTLHSLPGLHYLFDAAIPGPRVPESDGLRINLRAPLYKVSTGFWRPDVDTSLIIHRLEA